MKTNYIFQLLAIILLSVGFIACEEDGDEVSITETAMVLDDTKYVMDDVDIEAMEEHGEMMLFINASNDDASFNIGLYNYTGNGSYTLTEGSETSEGHAHFYAGSSSMYHETIKVTIVNDEEGSIAGSFSGTAHGMNVGETNIAVSGTFTQDDEGEEPDGSFIPASYLDTMQWTETWLVVFSDETMGFDFSINDYTSTNRDCYLQDQTFKYINSFLFEGENRLKKFGEINTSEPIAIPEEWDTSNSMLQVGSYYVAQCKDGYVVFKINGYMSCCGEFVMKFSFVPDSEID